MKVVKFIIIFIIIAALALLGYSSYVARMDEGLDVWQWSFDAEGENLIFSFDEDVNAHSAELSLNDETPDFIVDPTVDYINFVIDLKDIEQDELNEFKVVFRNEAGEEINRLTLKNVCVSSSREIPKQYIETLVLYDYLGDGLPGSDYDDLESLFILYSRPIPKAIELRDLIDLSGLKSLVVRSTGGVFGDINGVKHLTNLKRLNIVDNGSINGDIEDIDLLTRLKVLRLEGTNITGDIKDLVQLDNIVELTLVNNNRLGGDLKWLKKLQSLSKITVEGGRFEGEIESE